MGFNRATNIFERKNYQEALATRGHDKEEVDMEKRIQKAVDNIPHILEAATIVAITKALMRQGFTSASLRNMQRDEPDRLEKLCDPADPFAVIALAQYYEVNKNELDKKG